MLLTLVLLLVLIGLLIAILVKDKRENYPVTLSLPEWQRWIAQGKNTLYGGAIIPGGTVNTGWGGGGAVYTGHVRSGYGMADPAWNS